MRHQVLLIDPLYHVGGERILREQVDVTLLEKPTHEAVLEAAKGAHGICGRYPNRIDADVIDAAEDLLVICSSGRGTDAIDIEAATRRGVTVVNNPGFGKVPVSEHALFMMMSLSRHGSEHDAMTRSGRGWQDRLGAANTIHDLEGATLGLVGFGQIGTEMARKCAGAFSMRVIAYDPYVAPETAAAVGVTLLPTLEEVLSQADYVSVHAELNDETHHMFNDAAFGAMQPHACLINTARGKIVEQAALHRALTAGTIRAAALDVFEVEPVGPDNPLCALENIILSPHVGGLTAGFAEASAMSVAHQMLTVFRGKYPENIRNPDAWERTKQRAMRLLAGQ
ncbi:Predicted dehydrogenase [alpha proteobacterium BAL199]|jgi:phosphoglycerate dehydrogenase-like enzyme|nr:Predicted dehydrogenase [alpha proteobacterium BAL199]